jgi:LysR family transcriptional regulator, glycine cleavage system transcriptional activator
MVSDGMGEPDSQIGATRLPPLAALRCFEVAARLESFSQAADALHLTHGAVSRAVRAVEEDLGVALFERRNRRVFLTAAGRTLANAVREGLRTIEAATRSLRQSARNAPLTVSCEPTLLMRWLIPRLSSFQTAHPDIPIHLTAGGGPVTLGHGVDLAIRRDDFLWPDHVSANRLFAERVGPVCRADRVEAFFAMTGDGSPVLRPTAPRLHSRTRPGAWDHWNAATGRTVPEAAPDGPSQMFEHFYFSLQAAVAGLGVAIGPWQLVRDDVESGILAAPLGFVEDGSAYHLLSPEPLVDGGRAAPLLEWLRRAAA